MEKLQTDGLSYLKFGGQDDNGPLMLVLPGIGAFKENYITFAEQLAPYYSKGLILDLPQQGSKGRWRLGDMTELVDQLLQREGTARPLLLVGHSAGGAAALSHHLGINRDVEEHLISHSEIVEQLLAGSQKSTITGLTDFSNLLESKLDTAMKRQPQRAAKLILCAPPYNFATVFPPSLNKYLREWSSESLALLINLLTNLPFKMMSHFTKMRFKAPGIRLFDTNYFSLTIDDHQEFVEYILDAIHPMMLLSLMQQLGFPQAKDSKQVEKLLIYGKKDWLVRGNTKWYQEKFSPLPSCEILSLKDAGHIFIENSIMDVNINTQFLRHGEFLDAVKSFITT
jgi:pimeloyl-ACP methyl ester carboxylesterase